MNLCCINEAKSSGFSSLRFDRIRLMRQISTKQYAESEFKQMSLFRLFLWLLSNTSSRQRSLLVSTYSYRVRQENKSNQLAVDIRQMS